MTEEEAKAIGVAEQERQKKLQEEQEIVEGLNNRAQVRHLWMRFHEVEERVDAQLKGMPALHDELRDVLGHLAQKAGALKLPPKIVAKAALYTLAAWCIAVGDRVRVLGRKALAATAKVVYEGTRDPAPIVLPRTRVTQYPIGPLSGKKGEVKEITIEPEVTFQCQKLMATDESDMATGYATCIKQVHIKGKLQIPARTLTLFFAYNSFGNGVKFDWCAPGQKIHFQIEFLEDATFHGVLLGQEIVEEVGK